ncbi:hypothetical protein AGABI1DRAFT_108471 [Agaricus bisporus var. burnettii JB137-S8]|uniref:NACHT domain-containing protein n=1 Tax=Agaricus bisporus var. burnettii (strain JB137-S8 / ATCC MYA-4627 / FGSC 10392) TaxID=597362 RepID=K5WNB5_AGABU|nr:uncharacterized protein AGABI1DRAFT_108471 [Agaricus bisporus var. burnettii JB137-S8]EKM76826.1 hypothetical protein AGABI1DRAFT_108471 [Agaricus bisporus var. burnettii JB137-S8]
MPKPSLDLSRFFRFGRPRSQEPPQSVHSSIQNTHESKNISVDGDMNHINYNYTNTVVNQNSNKFMVELLEKTIPGAAFDSSARDPPPRCHPGTRLAILARCLDFIADASDEKKVRWVVGAAGVGKSAIMQNVAESPLPSVSVRASIFFSINGRSDGTKAIITLAFQLAAKCEPYRQFIEHEITRDPSLPQASVSVQFKKFVIEPFVHHPQLNSLGRVLIIVDGIDECEKSHTQRELLQLISNLCSTYPTSPVLWIIASRPESHITSFFAQDTVKAVYEREEILVDSDEARSDVEKFLRDELIKIQKEFSLNPQSQWPQEHELWKLANAAGGLFVYADTAMRYVGDRTSGNPTSQLNDVLKVIDAHPLPNISQEEHPMARLDVLYAQILSKIPERVMINARKILLALVWDSRGEECFRKGNFLLLCNWLDMTCDDAYAAIRLLSSVLDAPEREKAHRLQLRSYHKSFIDYLSDSNRSRFSSTIEARQLEIELTFKVLKQTPDGIDFGDLNMDYAIRGSKSFKIGTLMCSSGAEGNISLSWSPGGETDWDDNKVRLHMYKSAISNVVEGFRHGELAFHTEFCIRLITTRWDSYILDRFPFRELQNVVFAGSRHHEFVQHGILKEVSARMIDFTHIIPWYTRLRVCRPTATMQNLSDPWNPGCKHSRVGDWGEGKDDDWNTDFRTGGVFDSCDFCLQRLERQLDACKTRFSDLLATFLFTSTDKSFVEFRFIDPDDGVSEWTYRLVYYILEEERRRLGSAV